MKYFAPLFLAILSFNLVAQDEEWNIRAEILGMRSHDFIWLNNKGDFHWATSIFHDPMPCQKVLNETELEKINSLRKGLPRVLYEREPSNNQCFDGRRFFILSSSWSNEGEYLEVGKRFPVSKNCRVTTIDESWDTLSEYLYSLMLEKFETCRNTPWKEAYNKPLKRDS
ncbi:hypothetical protein [Pseudoalteromonas byunsanensis]|uniref:Uncharacterized protein n=1 Tax=Pseudoalteromonas byunsanensis TaxID=327939 RepID=A0A1S1N801_9GAMM|nr:hypothetical protein [Pseudoalteromonas byunsanensis]OHU94384.1 hypothetical protein BIW53_15010 [Pseudoalteromonas byunsanensis]